MTNQTPAPAKPARPINTRVAEARAAAKFGQIIARNSAGQITEVIIPGHEAKRYSVILRRDAATHTFTGECRLETAIGQVPCQGATRTVCYHTFAAILLAAGEAKMTVAYCADEEAANKLAHLGGTKYAIKSHGNDAAKVIWAVISK